MQIQGEQPELRSNPYALAMTASGTRVSPVIASEQRGAIIASERSNVIASAAEQLILDRINNNHQLPQGSLFMRIMSGARMYVVR